MPKSGRDEPSDSKDFQSLGAIALKKVKRSSDGTISETEAASKKAHDAKVAAKASSKGGERPPGIEASAFEQMSVEDGISLQTESGSVAISHFTPLQDLEELRVDEKTVLIGSPPLPAPVNPPDAVRALPSQRSGVLGLFSYGFKAPRIVQQQKNVVSLIGTEIAKLKKKEQELLSAMGRAARIHDMTPDECAELVEASQEEEFSSLEHRLKADEVEQAAQSADSAFKAKQAKSKAKLAALVKQKEGLEAKSAEAQGRLDAAESKLERLRQREAELRAAASGVGSEEEAAKRVKEYEAIKAQRKVIEMELETLHDQARGAKKPLGRIRDEIAIVQREVESAKHKLNAAENQVRAAKISGERRQEFTSRTVAEIDEEIGRTIISGAGRTPELRQLIVSAEVVQRRIAHWESVLAEQQGELDHFDERRAKVGFWALISVLIGILVVLLGGGEIVRRIFLNLEG